MRKAFLIPHGHGDCLATSNGRLIIATTEQEVRCGPSRRTVDIDNAQVTVTQWIEEGEYAGQR